MTKHPPYMKPEEPKEKLQEWNRLGTICRITIAGKTSVIDTIYPKKLRLNHYENTPIQMYRKFHQKLKKKSDKKTLIFFTLLQT